MKKIIILIMLLLMVSSESFGAVSDDVYVRKDVFDAKMEAMFNRLHGDIQALSERMDGNFAALSRRMDGLDKRMDGLDKRMDDLQHYLYLVLVLLGIIVALPSVQKALQWREERKEARKSSITLEDVERPIDARMAGKARA
ncbi:MAG: hypothetical protein IJP85_04105 [Synergistaceae bacterium]|nr:hypothetical protein [Synergistaceae bacterium]